MAHSFTIKSASSGKSYTITRGDDGVLYCSCPSWKFQKVPSSARRCKHTDQVLAAL